MRDRRPLTLQLRDELRELIRRDGLRAGDQLPAETELATRFAVGRTTVREALKTLEQDGLLDVRRGRGRFVSELPSLKSPLTRLESVTEMMDRLGYVVESKVLGVEVGAARGEESDALQLAPGMSVVRLERLRLQHGDPLIYSLDVFPRSSIDGPVETADWSGSLFRLLETKGRRIVSAAAQVRAATLPRHVARRVGRLAQRPWLLMVQRAALESGEPIVYSHDYHRGDVFTFHALRRRGQ